MLSFAVNAHSIIKVAIHKFLYVVFTSNISKKLTYIYVMIMCTPVSTKKLKYTVL